MQINNIFSKELVKRGYSRRGKTRVWDVSDSKLWYLTPKLAKGFLNLKKYNPYRKRVINDEIELIKKHAGKIVKKFGKKKFNLIDLGCGSGIKAEVFIKSMPKDVKVRYCPVDISQYYINKTIDKIRSMNSGKIEAIKPFLIDFKDIDNVLGLLRNSEYQNNLVLLFGETISHYDIHDLLFEVSQSMFKGDFLVIGNGIRKGRRFEHLEKYRDPLFNDWFIHIMNGLGFKDKEVSVDVRFTHERLEGFYHINVDKVIRYGRKKIKIKREDEVVVAIQYKFYEKELKKYCKMYFCDVEIFKRDKEYCLLVCKK